MNRTKTIIAAGTLTGLVFITILAFGASGLNAFSSSKNEPAIIQPTEVVQPQSQGEMVDAQTLQSWQQYSSELEQAVRLLQQREAAYQAQIEVANQTILQLQDQINSLNAGQQMNSGTTQFFGEHEQHEQFEHESFQIGD